MLKKFIMVIICISFILYLGCGGDINTPVDYVETSPPREEMPTKPLDPKTIRYNDIDYE